MREENEKNENESEDGVVEHSKVQELECRKMLKSLNLEGFEGPWRVTTADEWVERVGCMVRRSEMKEGVWY